VFRCIVTPWVGKDEAKGCPIESPKGPEGGPGTQACISGPEKQDETPSDVTLLLPISVPLRPPSDVIVSLTSFPARIAGVELTIASILRQSVQPEHVVLVVSEEEFPGRILPERLLRRQGRGLEILWTERNLRIHRSRFRGASEVGGACR
jgi:hypothetical protein